MIKNIGANLNTVSNSYSSGKIDKTDFNKSDSDTANKVSSSMTSSNVDTIEISYRPEGGSSTVADVRNVIVNDINKDADAQRLSDLKEKVDDGQYAVDANEMAKIMLGDQ